MRKKHLFLRKPLGHDQGHGVLVRHLKLHHLVSVGIGSIIGAGIFVITGQAAALYAGPAITLSFIIAALVCVFTALCYAELSALIPVSGGSYSFAYAALGEFPAFMVGWTVTCQYLVVIASVAVGWSGYLLGMLHDLGYTLSLAWTEAPIAYEIGKGWSWTGSICNLPALLVIVALGVLATVGTQAASRFNDWMVILKLFAVSVFIFVGVWFIQTDHWVPFLPANTGVLGQFGFSGVLRGAGLVFFAYLGFDTVATMAQETINPQRDLPKGILGSLGISALAYVATALVLTGIVRYTELNVSDPMAVALKSLGPSFAWINVIVTGAIVVGLASVILVIILAEARVLFSMSRDGLLFKRLGTIHPKTRTPAVSTVVTFCISGVIATLLPLNVLSEMVSMAALFVFTVVSLGVLVLRSTNPDAHRPFRVPLVPWIPLAAMIGCMVQMVFLSPLTWVEMMLWSSIGLCIYFGYSLQNSYLRKSS
jgi:APA family basic amino acid/polyamine antiporter